MKECCGNCKCFKAVYVPPLDVYGDIPKNGFVCTVFEEDNGRIMWLGTEEQGANMGQCEVFTNELSGVSKEQGIENNRGGV